MPASPVLGGQLTDQASGLGPFAKAIAPGQWVLNNGPAASSVWETSSAFLKYGTLALKLGSTVAGASGQTGYKQVLPLTYNFTSTDNFTLWVYCDSEIVSIGHGVDTQILIAFGDANFANSSYCNACGVAGGGWRKGWNNVTLTKADFSSVLSGSGVDWGAVKGLQIRFIPGANYPGNAFLYLDSFFVGGRLASGKTPVVICSDDTVLEAQSLANIAGSRGFPLSVFAISGVIDDHVAYPGSLTLTQLKDMYNAGHDIYAHGFGGSSDSGWLADPTQMGATRQWLIDKGFVRNECFNYGAYPGGAYTDSLIAAAKGYGFKGMRSVAGTTRSATYDGTTQNVLYEAIGSGGYSDAFKISGHQPGNSTAALAQVDIAIAKRTAYLSYTHRFSDITNQSNWESYMDGLASRVARGAIEVMTFGDFCRSYLPLV